MKNNSKVRTCINFRDLNAACPKDDFLFLITNVMINNTCGFQQMSFMDGLFRYNQIKMYQDDEKYSFIPDTRVYYYTICSLAEECYGYLSTCHEHHFLQSSLQDRGMVC